MGDILKTILLMIVAMTLCEVALAKPAPAPSNSTSPFEGTWNVKLTPDRKGRSAEATPIQDSLEFTNAIVKSKFAKQKGFESIEGELSRAKNGGADFDGTGKADGPEQVRINAHTADGKTITGTVTWVGARGHVMNYLLKGEKQEK